MMTEVPDLDDGKRTEQIGQKSRPGHKAPFDMVQQGIVPPDDSSAEEEKEETEGRSLQEDQENLHRRQAISENRSGMQRNGF